MNRQDVNQKQKEAAESLNLTNEVIISWLEIVNLFQTFDDLESVKDKQADIQAVRQVLDEEDKTGVEVRSC